LKQQVQALIFCSEQSISIDEIISSLKISFEWELTEEEVLTAIGEIKQQFASEEYSFELAEISQGYQFLTKKQYFPAVSALIQHKAKKKLSVSQMETLAIIAYRQPISKSEVEHIRGVSCDYAIQKLLEKELIEISGKSDSPGRPVLYSTSHSFMDYFGIKSVKDLPQLKDLHVDQNEIGTPADVLAESEESMHVITELPVEHHDTETGENSENGNPGIVSEDESAVEEIIAINADIEADSETECDEETVLYAHESESTGEEVTEIDDDLLVDNLDESDNLDIPDRKSIFLENETREIDEEERREEN